MQTLTLVPAYGRDYFTSAKAIQAWEAGQDWKLPGGPYVGKNEREQILADGFDSVCLRFNRREKSVTLAL